MIIVHVLLSCVPAVCFHYVHRHVFLFSVFITNHITSYACASVMCLPSLFSLVTPSLFRRKKKCIRVQMYLAGRTEQEIEATTFDEEGEAITPLGSGALLPTSGVANSCSSHGSDGEGGSPASQGGSIESSEHSLTSPATPGGGMSVASLGSPASIASPLTPGGSEDWFRTSVGYRPPVPNHRPVGTDPRDSKNPLSISSLTGCHSRENGLNGNDKMLGVT